MFQVGDVDIRVKHAFQVGDVDFRVKHSVFQVGSPKWTIFSWEGRNNKCGLAASCAGRSIVWSSFCSQSQVHFFATELEHRAP